VSGAVLHRQPVGQLHTHGSAGPLEAKVALPSLANGGVLLVVGAVLTLLQEFGVDLTEGQVAAIVGVTAALMPFVTFVVGYFTPHTPRPDLAAPLPAEET
jgi:F0F1-type ATP synthase assembly protein I